MTLKTVLIYSGMQKWDASLLVTIKHIFSSEANKFNIINFNELKCYNKIAILLYSTFENKNTQKKRLAPTNF